MLYIERTNDHIEHTNDHIEHTNDHIEHTSELHLNGSNTKLFTAKTFI